MNCLSEHYFDPSKSNTFKSYDEIIDLDFISNKAYGLLCSESISITGYHDLKASNLSFVLATYDNFNDDKFDGMLSIYQFVSQLKSEGMIENASFSLFLSNNNFTDKETDLKSNLIIDGYDLDSYSSEKSFKFVNYLNENEKSIQIKGVTFGNLTLESSLAKIYTSSPFIYGPVNQTEKLLTNFVSNFQCVNQEDETITCDCSQLYPDLEFELEGTTLFLQSSYYFEKSGDKCELKIKSYDSDF